MEHTISAISTPVGTGGISVIRISGDSAFSVVAKIFKSKTPFEKIKSHTVTYGTLHDFSGKTVDKVLVLKMKAPDTYTKEDVAEIHCHGGIFLTRKILELTHDAGAVPAQPGEFTKRAFINGQMDLMEAEAVMDLINSEADSLYKDAILQLKGEKSNVLKRIRSELIDIISHVMVTIDYPEYDFEKDAVDEIKEKAKRIKTELEMLVDNFDNRRIIREGLNVAVTGDVNVGKSTFINRALGQNRVIVTDIAGTTRDVVEVKIDVKGLCVTLKDTAGIRDTDDEIEKIGIEKSKEAIEQADAVIYIADINSDADYGTIDYIKNLDKAICVLNKTDLLSPKDKDARIDKREKELFRFFKDRVISCSLNNEEGINEIFDKLLEMTDVNKIMNDTSAITNVRHKNHIKDAIKCLDNMQNGTFIDMLSVDLTCAADELGKITGETASTDIIDRIFRKFCVGK